MESIDHQKRGVYCLIKSPIVNVSERNVEEVKLRIMKRNYFTVGVMDTIENLIIAWEVSWVLNEPEQIRNFNEKLNEIVEYEIEIAVSFI